MVNPIQCNLVLRQSLDTKGRDVRIVYMLGKECSRCKNNVYDEDFKKMIVELYESKTITAANIVREYGIGSAILWAVWKNTDNRWRNNK